ncbi:MAG: YedE-related selenium metabolism membrane protein [Clostridiales bacterium]|nr:YedE-related selenium metabolism membrane protein [Clostridiales bacterium]
MKKRNFWVILTGVVIGVAAIVLTALGNPGNMGFCIACFIRDTSGAMKLHTAAAVQYVRPEIIGMILGAMIVSMLTKEFKPRGGSSPMTRFVLAVVVMVGALMFLGCPLRMMLRIGGGDLNALVGLVGFIAGIFVGTLWLRGGFTLKRAYAQSMTEGLMLPIIVAVLMVLSALLPSLFAFSESGPGAAHAPLLIALGIGLVVGGLCQRARFCTVAGNRDAMMFKDFSMLWGFLAVIVTTIVGNLILGKFHLSFADQPVAHTDGLWNFLGMALVGWGSVLLGGCPLRQVILAGEGNSDAAITVTGFVFGAAICHNFGLASSGNGPTVNGMIAVVAGFVILVLIGLFNRERI